MDLADTLSDVLQSRGKLGAGDLRRARGAAGADQKLHRVLCRLGLVGEGDMAEALAECLGLPLARADAFPPMPLLAGALPASFLRQAEIVPLAEEGTALRIAMADPLDDAAADALALRLGRPILRAVALPGEVARYLDQHAGEGAGGAAPALAESGLDAESQPDPMTGDAEIARLKDMARDAPVIQLVNRLIADAVSARASDLHIEPGPGEMRLRQRIDGRLQAVPAPSAALHAGLVSRIKILAGLDIVERRLPQDGRFRMQAHGRTVDVRVSVMPTLHGESLALRILDKTSAPLSLGALGFAAGMREAFSRLLAAQSGIILVTGPTGSGKSTTLYAALEQLNHETRNLVTIEDPVEYELPGVRQIQIRPAIGLGFADVLRAVLRHDPDVIMVGEIRDQDTARIAVRAALTGHLVLSTLHTRDAAGAVARLADMGVPRYLIASALSGVIAQRLVRRLCPTCRAPADVPADMRRALGIVAPDAADGGGAPTLYRAAGCAECGGTGYRGRIAVAELMPADGPVASAILESADGGAVARAAAASGMRPLGADAIAKLIAGETSLDDILPLLDAN